MKKWVFVSLAIVIVFSLVILGCGDKKEYSLTIAVIGQGITNPDAGTHTYKEGESLNITANPANGWKFDGWSGDASGNNTTVVLRMDGNKGITANFSTMRHPTTFGPSSFNIGTGQGDWPIPNYLNVGDRAEFSFTVAGSDVRYSVIDPNGNAVLTGSGGNKVQSGAGSFIAATRGYYKVHFLSAGILTSSVLTINGTVYPAN